MSRLHLYLQVHKITIIMVKETLVFLLLVPTECHERDYPSRDPSRRRVARLAS